MRVTVRLFARLRDLAGTSEVPVSVAAQATVEDVWSALATAHPALAPFRPSIAAALNDDYARMSAVVADGDEVAFLPPVSGGCAAPAGIQRGKPPVSRRNLIETVRPPVAIRRGPAGRGRNLP